MKILACDTGPTTGLATWDSEGEDDTALTGQVWSTALTRNDAEDFIANYIPRVDLVIAEKLTISMATIKKGRQVQESIEMVGLIKTLCRWHGVDLDPDSQPGQAMNFATDAKLKRVGWYVPGPDHERDARRHILTKLANLRLIDVSTLLAKE